MDDIRDGDIHCGSGHSLYRRLGLHRSGGASRLLVPVLIHLSEPHLEIWFQKHRAVHSRSLAGPLCAVLARSAPADRVRRRSARSTHSRAKLNRTDASAHRGVRRDGVFRIQRDHGAPVRLPEVLCPRPWSMALLAIAPFGLSRSEFVAWRLPWTTLRVAVVAMSVVVLVGVGYIEYARRSVHMPYPAWPLWLLIAVGFVMAVVMAVFVRPLRARSLVFCLASLAAATLVAALVVTDLSADLAQRSSPGSVRYFPGERDFAVTIAKLRALTLNHSSEEHAILISAKDVGV